MTLYQKFFNTKLGKMVAISDDKDLLLLHFSDKPTLDSETKNLINNLNDNLVNSSNNILNQIEQEIHEYLNGTLHQFNTPYRFDFGTPFQQKVWQALSKIPYGEKISYKQLAKNINHPTSFRACANANGKNHLTIIVPCHRVIATDGSLGGYSSGLDRKQFMLEMEAKK